MQAVGSTLLLNQIMGADLIERKVVVNLRTNTVEARVYPGDDMDRTFALYDFQNLSRQGNLHRKGRMQHGNRTLLSFTLTEYLQRTAVFQGSDVRHSP